MDKRMNRVLKKVNLSKFRKKNAAQAPKVAVIDLVHDPMWYLSSRVTFVRLPCLRIPAAPTETILPPTTAAAASEGTEEPTNISSS